MAEFTPPDVGELRSRISLAYRVEIEDPTDAGESESINYLFSAWAKIEPLGNATYINSMQTDEYSTVTHRMWILWQNINDQYNVVIRKSILPDNTFRFERFRTQRISEIQGIRRWLVIECEQEIQNAII